MYRIRVINSDGTLGGFFTDTGIVEDVSLAKTYSSNLAVQSDLVRAYNMSGAYYQPLLNYGIETQPAADEEKALINNSVNIMNGLVGKVIQSSIGLYSPVLPPFEDKPSATNLGQALASEVIINDIDGGFLNQLQEFDIDGGGA